MSNNEDTFKQAVDRHSEERSRFLAELNKASEKGRLNQFPVYADEEFGQLVYCEQKAVFNRNCGKQKSNDVERAVTVNEAARHSLPTSTVPRKVNDEMLKHDGYGAFLDYHPTLERNDLWIRCFPDLFIFSDDRPVFCVRLRGTTQDYLHSQFENRELPSWLTCRVMEQLGFDTSEMYYVIIKYNTDYYYREGDDDGAGDKVSEAELLATLEMRFVQGEYSQISAALEEFDHLSVEVHDYESGKFADKIYRYIQIWKGERDPQGADIEGKCESCEFKDTCTLSLV